MVRSRLCCAVRLLRLLRLLLACWLLADIVCTWQMTDGNWGLAAASHSARQLLGLLLTLLLRLLLACWLLANIQLHPKVSSLRNVKMS